MLDLLRRIGWSALALFMTLWPSAIGVGLYATHLSGHYTKRINPEAEARLAEVENDCQSYLSRATVSPRKYELCKRIEAHRSGCASGKIPAGGRDDANDDTEFGCRFSDRYDFLRSLDVRMPRKYLPNLPVPLWLTVVFLGPTAIVQILFSVWMLRGELQEYWL